MEAQLLHSIQPCKWGDTENMMRKPGGFFRVSLRNKEVSGSQMLMTIQPNRRISARCKLNRLKVSNSLKNASDPVLKSGGFHVSVDESLVLKEKSAEIEPILNARCIYLVGMMGSGKTTIGRVLSEALDYSFYDSDSLVEQTTGLSIAEIFNQYGEGFFREKETEALKELSIMNRLVVSTGGGAVVRPINWKHMRSGISVWLDVPIDCLARRISAVGTGSRPLLHGESRDAYSKAFTRLSTLLEERGESYANANTRVSFEHIAAKLGSVDVDTLTPAVIAIEVLEQIEKFLKDEST